MNTLFDKIWDSHIVSVIDGGPTQLYIDRLYCHEVTSPQAFEGIRKRGCGILRPERIICMPDHDIPTEGLLSRMMYAVVRWRLWNGTRLNSVWSIIR